MRWITIVLWAILLAPAASAQDVTFTTIPRHFQLIPRDASNSGEVRVSGSVNAVGYDSVRLDFYRNRVIWRSVRAGLRYENGRAPFDLAARIPAELAEYDMSFYLDGAEVTSRERIVCGDVYLVDGQSNAQTHGGYSYRNEFIRSFGSSLDSPTALADTTWGFAQAYTVLSHVFVGAWAMEMGKVLIETYGVPIAILNGAAGGTLIVHHLRNDAYPMDPNTLYGRLLWRAAKAGVEHGVIAILWHQGESDSDSTWVNYRESFTRLWNAWREDFAPQKVYVFQIHPGCGYDYQSQIREVQRTQPEYFGNVEVMATVGVAGHDGCHYSIDGYCQMGHWISHLIARDFYGESDTLDIRPPNVQRIWFSSPAQDELRIQFDCAVSWPADTLGLALKDYVYLDGTAGAVVAGRADDGDPRTLVLTLNGPSSATRVTYLPNLTDDLGEIYEGPFIRGRRGVGALTFFEFPIMDPAGVPPGAGSASFPSIEVAPNPVCDRGEVRFTLPRAETVRVEILDTAGRVVERLADRALPAGPHALPWGAKGDRLPAGLYFVRCRTSSGIESHVKVVRLR